MKRIWIAGVLNIVLGVFAGVFFIPGQAQAGVCVNIPAWAHRGDNIAYDENTLNAFRKATLDGVPRWETDVQFTSDNVPVIRHDAMVDSTTNGTGAIADMTYAQLSVLRTSDGQRIPTLEDLVNDAEVDSARVLMELKVRPTPDQWQAVRDALNSRAGTSSRFVVTSFDTATLDDAKTELPGYTRGLIEDPSDEDPANVLAHATVFIKHHYSITAARMAKWVGAGLTVYAWTVDGPSTTEWARMAWYPTLAGVLTNQPEQYEVWQKDRVC